MNTLLINSPRSVNKTINSNANEAQTESLQKLTPSYFIGKCVEIQGKRADWSELYQENSQLDTTLPQEMLTHILKYVNAQSLGKLSQVSRFWNIQAHAARNYKVLDISCDQVDVFCNEPRDLSVFEDHVASILKSLNNNEHRTEFLDMSHWDTGDRDKNRRMRQLPTTFLKIIRHLPKSLKYLKTLNLENFRIRSLNHLNNYSFLSAAKSLTCLNLNGTDCPISYIETVANLYTELEDLSIGRCTSLVLENYYYDSNADKIITIVDGISHLLKLSKLRRLDLSKACGLTHNSIQVISSLKVLKILILENCSIGDECIEIFNTFESLEYINLRGTSVTLEGLEALNSKIRVDVD